MVVKKFQCCLNSSCNNLYTWERFIFFVLFCAIFYEFLFFPSGFGDSKKLYALIVNLFFKKKWALLNYDEL